MKPLIAELNMNRRLGVEHEMAVPLVGSGGGREVQETIAHVLTSNGLRAKARGYTNAPVPNGYDLAIEADSSVRGEQRFGGVSWHSVELKTRILNGISDWESIVPKALEIAKYMGARVNRSCGYHLTIDFPEAIDKPTKIRSLFNLIHASEPFIYAILPPSRRSNGYARPIPPERLRMLHGCRTLRSFERALANWERNRGLNLTHLFSPSPRIEFRYHSGSLDAVKCRHWLRLINRLVEHSITRNCQASNRSVTPTVAEFDNWLMTIGLRSHSGIYRKISPELRETAKYIRRRFKKFAAISSAGADSSQEGEE